MPTTALYHWSVAGCPVNVLIELPVVERLRTAALATDQEIGGLLIGSFDGNYTIISDFEEIESEHRRGIGYQLSSRDERKMAGRIEARSQRKQGNVVGLFRSHRRPGLYLDESDNGLLSSYFHSPQQVALLIKPEGDGSATGGFFFWEEGAVNRKQTYLPFPMDAKQLEEGDFPLVEPVDASGGGHSSASVVVPPAPVQEPIEDWTPARVRDGAPIAQALPFDYADTLDELPGARVAAPATPVQPPASKPAPAGVRRAVLPAPPPENKTPSSAGFQRFRWPVVLGMVAAVAAFGGYIFGTASSHNDQFGSRPGDIAINSQPAAPEPVKPAAVAQQPAPAARISSPENPASSPVPAPVQIQPAAPVRATAAPLPKPKPAIPAAPAPTARKAVASVLAYKPSSPPAPVPAAPVSTANVTPQPTTPSEPAPAPVSATKEPPSRPGFAWSHYATPAASAASVSGHEEGAETAISVEPVESGSLKRVAHHIPLIGSIGGAYEGGEDFTPAQAVHTFAPKVPADLARSLTAPLPIDLKLKLDKTGRVRSVEVISKQKAREFVELAGGAAYQWQFEPAHVKDKSVPSEVIAHFRFRPAM